MLVSPIKRHIVGLSYLTSVFAVSLCICFAVLIVAFVYLALTGWYLSAKDVFGIVGLTALSALFAALLSVIICSFISTQGAHGAFTGIMSAAIGFLVGALYAAFHVSEGCAFRRAVCCPARTPPELSAICLCAARLKKFLRCLFKRRKV